MDDLAHELSNAGVHEHEAILAKFEVMSERLTGPYARYTTKMFMLIEYVYSSYLNAISEIWSLLND